MGFLRKTLFVSTGGLSGLFFKANSKKERTAKALEKGLKLQKAQFELQKSSARVQPSTASGRTAPRSTVADELASAAALREKGLLSEDEFQAVKRRILERPT